MNLITGGHYDKKGYYYRFFLCFPTFKTSKCKNILNKEHLVTELSLDTGFSLTRNPNYVKILFKVAGFGLGIEIHMKDGN